MAPKVASAFLSYRSSDSDERLVRAVAGEMVVRGVPVWLDTRELTGGMDIARGIREAIRENATLVAFLSKKALRSPWVRRELDEALRLERAGQRDHIVPVVLERGVVACIRSYRPLRARWMDLRRVKVQKKYVPAWGRTAKELAADVARSLYELLKINESQETLVIFDQRGTGSRRAVDRSDRAVFRLSCPALRFWPDLEPRAEKRVIRQRDWSRVGGAVLESLRDALHLAPSRARVHWFGNCQMALAALFGKAVRRSSGRTLVLWDREGNQSLELDLSRYQEPLAGGRASTAVGSGTGGAAILLSK